MSFKSGLRIVSVSSARATAANDKRAVVKTVVRTALTLALLAAATPASANLTIVDLSFSASTDNPGILGGISYTIDPSVDPIRATATVVSPNLWATSGWMEISAEFVLDAGYELGSAGVCYCGPGSAGVNGAVSYSILGNMSTWHFDFTQPSSVTSFNLTYYENLLPPPPPPPSDGGDVSPVPEPETYAMLLAGLGMLGWHARRRKQKKIAAA